MATVPAPAPGTTAATATATDPSGAAGHADTSGLRVVYGRPTDEELAAVVAVLLLAARESQGAASAPHLDEPAEPAWLRGPYSAPTSWTAGL